MKKTLLLLVFFKVLTTSTIAQSFSTTILPDWLELHCRLVKQSKGIGHVAYSRHFAYTAIACYESIVGGHSGYRSLNNQLNGLSALPAKPKGEISWPSSLNAAYAEMLRYFYSSFGNSKASIDSMEDAIRYQITRNGGASGDIDKSMEYGKAIATAIILWSKSDGSDIKKDYKPLQGEGIWTPETNAAVPYWSENRPMIKDVFSVYALQPPVYSKDKSSDFYKMANEVYAVSQEGSAEKKDIAFFWDDSPNGKYLSVFGHWTSILSQLLREQEFPFMKATEAYARMTIAMYDATLLAWKGKYQYNVLRPITYIRQNIKKEWSPLIETPPHPEFPAAHATFSSAAATALCVSFGEACKLTDRSYLDIGMKERSFATLQEAAREAGMSRMYGGIHYRHSIEEGFKLGEAVAKHSEQSIKFKSSEKDKAAIKASSSSIH